MYQRHLIAALVLSAACTAKAGERDTAARIPVSSPVAADTTAKGAAAPASPTAPAAPGKENLTGRIPVLEYHVIGSEKNAAYSRTTASFLADLEEAYRRGYRPVTMSQVLEKDFRDVPAGMSPVVLVFDDASDSQFRYVERNGTLEVDPTSGVGLLLAFAKSHPGWKNRATFCMLNGGAAGHNFFGDATKFGGQKKEWRFTKVKWLADNGFELCAHTLWHARLDKYSDAVVQEQIARNVMGIDSAVAGYRIRTFALPYGIWPKNRPLAWAGSWTDPKTGKAHPYKFEAVLEVSGGPTRSPYDPKFDAHSVTRVEAIGDDIRRVLARLDSTGTRMVIGGK